MAELSLSHIALLALTMKAVDRTHLRREEEDRFSILVLHARNGPAVEQWYILFLLASWVRVELCSDGLGLFAERYSRNFLSRERFTDGLQICTREHLWLWEYELEDWVVGNVRPVYCYI